MQICMQSPATAELVLFHGRGHACENCATPACTLLLPEPIPDAHFVLAGSTGLVHVLCAASQVQPFNINVTDGEKTCNRGEDWGSYKGVVNCNTCRLPGLRITKESIWGFFEGRTPEDRLGLPLERAQVVGFLNTPAVSLCKMHALYSQPKGA